MKEVISRPKKIVLLSCLRLRNSRRTGSVWPPEFLTLCWRRAVPFALLTNLAFAASNASQLPNGPGKETTEKVCSGCHAAEIVLGHRDTKQGWTQIVSDMVDKGANGTDAEFNTIIDYLAAHFPVKSDSKAPQ